MQLFTQQTGNVKITAAPLFIAEQSQVQQSMFFWAYNIKIENLGNSTLKLLTRHWRIIDANGDIQEVNGVGVVGQQPVIAPNSMFQYASGTFLKTPSGVMVGTYVVVEIETDKEFQVNIPAFSLDSPYETHIPS